MTEELEKRLESKKKPFDSFTLYSVGDLLKIDILHLVLQEIANSLRTKYPKINFMIDWFNHDGFVNNHKKKNWAYFDEKTENIEALFNKRDLSDDVYLSFFPENLDWLLRFNVDEEDQTNLRTAYCDLTFSYSDIPEIEEIIKSISLKYNKLFKIEESESYFKNIYGGN